LVVVKSHKVQRNKRHKNLTNFIITAFKIHTFGKRRTLNKGKKKSLQSSFWA
jgi:hypothetical protein